MSGRAVDRIEGDLEDELVLDLAHRPVAADGVVADPAVEEAQLLVGEAEIGLADRDQLRAPSDPSRQAPKV